NLDAADHEGRPRYQEFAWCLKDAAALCLFAVGGDDGGLGGMRLHACTFHLCGRLLFSGVAAMRGCRHSGRVSCARGFCPAFSGRYSAPALAALHVYCHPDRIDHWPGFFLLNDHADSYTSRQQKKVGMDGSEPRSVSHFAAWLAYVSAFNIPSLVR